MMTELYLWGGLIALCLIAGLFLYFVLFLPNFSTLHPKSPQNIVPSFKKKRKQYCILLVSSIFTVLIYGMVILGVVSLGGMILYLIYQSLKSPASTEGINGVLPYLSILCWAGVTLLFGLCLCYLVYLGLVHGSGSSTPEQSVKPSQRGSLLPLNGSSRTVTMGGIWGGIMLLDGLILALLGWGITTTTFAVITSAFFLLILLALCYLEYPLVQSGVQWMKEKFGSQRWEWVRKIRIRIHRQPRTSSFLGRSVTTYIIPTFKALAVFFLVCFSTRMLFLSPISMQGSISGPGSLEIPYWQTQSVTFTWSGASRYPVAYTIYLDDCPMEEGKWNRREALSYTLPSDLHLGHHQVRIQIHDALTNIRTAYALPVTIMNTRIIDHASKAVESLYDWEACYFNISDDTTTGEATYYLWYDTSTTSVLLEHASWDGKPLTFPTQNWLFGDQRYANYHLRLELTDGLGETASIHRQVQLLENYRPKVFLETPRALVELGDRLPITIQVEDWYDTGTVYLFQDGIEVAQFTYENSSTFSYIFDSTQFRDLQAYHFMAKVEDSFATSPADIVSQSITLTVQMDVPPEISIATTELTENRIHVSYAIYDYDFQDSYLELVYNWQPIGRLTPMADFQYYFAPYLVPQLQLTTMNVNEEETLTLEYDRPTGIYYLHYSCPLTFDGPLQLQTWVNHTELAWETVHLGDLTLETKTDTPESTAVGEWWHSIAIEYKLMVTGILGLGVLGGVARIGGYCLRGLHYFYIKIKPILLAKWKKSAISYTIISKGIDGSVEAKKKRFKRLLFPTFKSFLPHARQQVRSKVFAIFLV